MAGQLYVPNSRGIASERWAGRKCQRSSSRWMTGRCHNERCYCGGWKTQSGAASWGCRCRSLTAAGGRRATMVLVSRIGLFNGAPLAAGASKRPEQWRQRGGALYLATASSRLVACGGVLGGPGACSLARLVLDGEFRCAKQNGWAVRSRVVGQQEDGRLRSGRGIPRRALLLDGWVLVLDGLLVWCRSGRFEPSSASSRRGLQATGSSLL